MGLIDQAETQIVKLADVTIEGLPNIKLSEHGYFGDLIKCRCVSFSNIIYLRSHFWGVKVFVIFVCLRVILIIDSHVYLFHPLGGWCDTPERLQRQPRYSMTCESA